MSTFLRHLSMLVCRKTNVFCFRLVKVFDRLRLTTFILTPRFVCAQTETQNKLKVICGDTEHGLERITLKRVILLI